MAKFKTYAEKLRDPRWQRLRLDVLNDAHWECQHCGETEKELQVHHPAYRRGAEPWDYDREELVCLCFACHKKAEVGKAVLSEMLLGDQHTLLHMDLADGRVDEAVYAFADILAKYIADNGIVFGYCSTDSNEARLISSSLRFHGVKIPGWCEQ